MAEKRIGQTDMRSITPLFDVDGVYTNPETKKPHPLLLGYTATRLFYHAPVGIASSRDFAWIDANIVDPLRPIIPISNLNNLFISTEKGAITTTYVNGEIQRNCDESLRVGEEIGNQLQERVGDYPGIFYYPKETLFTAEIYGGVSPDVISEQNRQLDELFGWVQKKLLTPGSLLKADRTAIAIDIYHSLGSKKISARKFLVFLEDRGFNLSNLRFITFGDSLNDLEMADGIKESGNEIEFCWVGRGSLGDSRGHRIITPNSGETNDLGTVALLRQLGELDQFPPIAFRFD